MNRRAPPFKAYQGDEPYIFVSYAHEDSDVVYPEVQWLKDQGFNIWFDEGISPGHEWRDELAARIEGSSLFLFWVSHLSVASEHCRREVNFAVDLGKPLLVVHLEQTDLPSGLNMTLGSTQAILRQGMDALDYRIKLLSGASENIRRGIAATDAGTPTTRAEPRPLRVSDLVLPIQVLFQSIDITPDGNQVVFIGAGPNGQQIFVRPLRDRVNLPLPGTESAITLNVSRDGASLAFRAEQVVLKRTLLSGGTASTDELPSGSFALGSTLGPDSSIVFSGALSRGSLMRISLHSSTPEQLTTPDQGEAHVHPWFFPDGDRLLFCVRGSSAEGRVALMNIATGEITKLVDGMAPRVAASGHLLVMRGNTLWAMAFDVEQGMVTGQAVPVVQKVATGQGQIAQYAVSDEGTLV